MNHYIKKIQQINFGFMSPEDIRKMSAVTVEYPDTYGDDGFPIEKGLMDPYLGVIDPSLVCRTCGFKGGDCPGHFGSIELARPVIHVGFGDVIHKILRSTCNHCGRILLSDKQIEEFTEKIEEAMENKEDITNILKKLLAETKKNVMSEAKLEEIVRKIMREVYPERYDGYDDEDRLDILLDILNQLYLEAYMERNERDYDISFKYIDPKFLCPHCKKNQKLSDIESIYGLLFAQNMDELNHIHRKVVNDIEKAYEGDYIEEDVLEEEIFNEYKKRTKDFVKQYLQDLIQEPIILDKPVTIIQGDYKLTPSEVRERLEKIPDDDAYILGINPDVARPEWMVLTVLPVPPVTMRPSITYENGEKSEDDLTHKLVDILRMNQRLLENMEAGAPHLIVEDLWELLQYHVTTYFDNEASGVPPARYLSGKPLVTLTQRLKGKDGRFRSNLVGKRVNFSARTVITPDPNISINEVGVPEMIAKEVTVPVYVNEWNIDEMRGYIENGPDVLPGANYVISNNRKRRVTEDTKEVIVEILKPGDIVERHLKDGDMVLFNRQPSLHRMSMMAHEVRVMPYKTFRINLCVCPPYNADFDGDEMNMHVFQTDESRAEAKSLMRVQEHILSPRFGGPIIGGIHDHLSGAYLLTRDGMEFTEEEALQIIRKSHLEIPLFKAYQWVLKYSPDFGEESFIFKDKGDKWTGKELFSLLLPNDFNLSFNAEISKCPVVYPPEDAFVVIENGILVQGAIDEASYGSFSGKILDKIVKEYGPGRAIEFLNQATDMAICAIMKAGITTSLNDEEIPEEAQNRINEHLNKKMEEVDMLVQSFEEGYLQALPGRSLNETLEIKIMQVLGEARDMSGSIAENYLTMGKQYPDDPYDHVRAVENHSVVMARTGARASMLNLTQITACVGQQAVRGGRIERGYLNRTLPHFKKGDLSAKAKGFIHSSYTSGLNPIEFFFHAMGGREGLVDTAIRTAQSGYMQRRLVNALQDLQVKSSGIVTDNLGNVIQTIYGEDGVDPAKSDFGKVVDLDKLIDEIRLKGDYASSDGDSISYSQRNTVKSRINNDVNKLKDISRKISYQINYIEEYVENPIFNKQLSSLNDSLLNLKEEINSKKDDISKLILKVDEVNSIDELNEIYPAGSNNDLIKSFDSEFKKLESEILRIVKSINESETKLDKLNELLDSITDYVSEIEVIKNIVEYEINDLKYIKTDLHEDLIDMKNNLVNSFKLIIEQLDNKSNDLNGISNSIMQDMSNLEFNNVNNYENEINNFNEFNNLIRVELNDKLEESSDVKMDIQNRLEQYISQGVKSEATPQDKVKKLKAYHRLLKDGVITDEEFNQLKHDLIFN